VEIRKKTEFFRLWTAGALGHRLRIWTDPQQVDADHVGFRQVGPAGGGRFEVVARDQISNTATRWCRDGLSFVICEVAPDDRCTLQGEVSHGIGGWCGTLGLSHRLRMRDAFAVGHIIPRSPCVTRHLLRTYCSPASLDDLDALLDLYPDAVIELSCYDVDFGRGRNTIFWEVRNY
jgi:hypothetical protein